MEHQFNINLAKQFGVEEAIIIHNLYFWINKNSRNGRHFHEGRYWTYNSVKAFSSMFPYMSTSKIGRVLKKLQEEGFLLSGNYNEIAFDRTCWYAFSNEACLILSSNGYDCIGFTESSVEPKETTKKEVKQVKKEKPEMKLSLPYNSEKFIEAWNSLKLMPKWKGKPESALQKSLDKLARYEEEFAIYLINESIEKNWTGVVFDNTDDDYNKWKLKRNGKSDNGNAANGNGWYGKSSSNKESSRNSLEELANAILGQHKP